MLISCQSLNNAKRNIENNYLSQDSISELPIIPVDYVQKNTVYPHEADENVIEVIVILKLFIDNNGNLNKIEILQNPGNGFAEAAVNGFKDKNGKYIKCIPAKINGTPVAVNCNFPIKFKLKK